MKNHLCEMKPQYKTYVLPFNIVWEKIAGGNFQVKIFHIEIFSSSWVQKFLTVNNYLVEV